MAAGRIYSVGYEGFTAAALVDRLSSDGVDAVIDVRLNPVSRKPGLSGRALAEAFEVVGIEYVHEPELGNPAENRDSFRRGDGSEGRAAMRVRLEDSGGAALARLVERAAPNGRVAVLCVEREHRRCHRQVITEMAVALDPSLEVVRIH